MVEREDSGLVGRSQPHGHEAETRRIPVAEPRYGQPE